MRKATRERVAKWSLSPQYRKWFAEDDPLHAMLMSVTNQVIDWYAVRQSLTLDMANRIQALTDEQTFGIWVGLWTGQICREYGKSARDKPGDPDREWYAHGNMMANRCADFLWRERRYWIDVLTIYELPVPAWLCGPCVAGQEGKIAGRSP